MASRNVSVHTMSLYVIDRTNYVNPIIHITMTNKSATTSNYVNKTSIYLSKTLAYIGHSANSKAE